MRQLLNEHCNTDCAFGWENIILNNILKTSFVIMAGPPPDARYLLRGNMGCVHSLLFRLNTPVEHLYAGTASGKVVVWDLNKNREISSIEMKNDPCLGMHNPDDSTLLTQQKCGTINTFSLTESQWTLNKDINIGHCSFCRIQILSDDLILVPLMNSNIGLLSLKTFKIESKLDPMQNSNLKQLGEIMAIKTIKDSTGLILAAYEGGQLILWDARKQDILNLLMIEPCPMALDYNAPSMKGVVGGPSNKLQIFKIGENHELSMKSSVTLKNSGTSVLSIRPDSKLFTVGGWDGRLRMFSWKNYRQLAVLTEHKDTIHDVVYSSNPVQAYDYKYLTAAAGKDGYVSLWDIYS